MSNIKHIEGKRTPEIMASELDWKNMDRCIVIYESGDDVIMNFSDMTWRDHVFLSAALQNSIVSGYKP